MKKFLLILLALVQVACLPRVEDIPALIDYLEVRRDLLPVDVTLPLRAEDPVAEKLIGAFLRYALEQQITVYVSETLIEKHGWVGVYDKDNNALYLDTTVAGAGRAMALIHELSHWCSPQDVLDTKTEAEVVAEATTFLVTSRVRGWNWGNYSLAYIIWAVPAYSRNAMLERNVDIINKCADKLSDVIPPELRKD